MRGNFYEKFIHRKNKIKINEISKNVNILLSNTRSIIFFKKMHSPN